jgi:hypothetical protein
VLRTVPPGFGFRIGFAKLNTADPIEVRKIVLGHAWEAPPAPDSAKLGPNGQWVEEVLRGRDRDPLQAGSCSIHEESHGGREMFALGCSVIPYFNQTNLVRVALVAVFPSPEANGSNGA